MWALPSLGLALAGTGRYDEAADVFAEARRLGRDYGAETLLARSIACSAGFRLDLYDFAGAEAVSEEAREMAWSLGFAPPAISAGIDLIMNYARRGEVDRAERVVAEVVDGVEQAAGFHGWLWRLRLAEARAELALARGEWEDAIRLADEAAGQSRTRGRAKYEVLGLVTRAAGLTASGRSREALAALESAVALARPVGDPALFLRAAAGLLAIGGSDALAAEGRAVCLRVAEGLSDSDLRCQFRNAEALQVVSR
jgi:tetratricopeptide (TPR) repeat protein